MVPERKTEWLELDKNKKPSKAQAKMVFSVATTEETQESRKVSDKSAGEKLYRRVRTPRNVGTYIGIIGIIIAIFGAFGPLYHLTIDADINAVSTTEVDDGDGTSKKSKMVIGNYSTNGTVEVFSLDGLHGVTLRKPTETGKTSPTKIPAPIGLSIILSLGIGALIMFFAKTAGRRARRLIYCGIITLLPVIIIVITINQLPSILERTSDEKELQPPFSSFVVMVAHSPFGGLFPMDLQYEVSEQTIGSHTYEIPYAADAEPIPITGGATMKLHVVMAWGLCIGAYILIIAGAIQIIGGLIDYYIGKFNEMKYKAYKEVLARVIADGVVSVDEDNLVRGLRVTLKIPDDEYNRIYQEVIEEQKLR